MIDWMIGIIENSLNNKEKGAISYLQNLLS